MSTALAPDERPRRLPLTPRQRRGAAIGGMVGWTLISIGFGTAAGAIAAGTAIALVDRIIDALRSPNAERAIEEFVGRDPGAWSGGLLALGITGAVVWLAGILVSRFVLGAHGVRRPWAVTWSSIAVAILVSWILGAIGSVVLPTMFGAMVDDLHSLRDVSRALASGIGTILLGGLGSIALTVLTGWLVWWAMAQAFRPTVVAVPADELEAGAVVVDVAEPGPEPEPIRGEPAAVAGAPVVPAPLQTDAPQRAERPPRSGDEAARVADAIDARVEQKRAAEAVQARVDARMAAKRAAESAPAAPAEPTTAPVVPQPVEPTAPTTEPEPGAVADGQPAAEPQPAADAPADATPADAAADAAPAATEPPAKPAPKPRTPRAKPATGAAKPASGTPRAPRAPRRPTSPNGD